MNKPICNCGLGMLPFDNGNHYETCQCYPKSQTPETDAAIFQKPWDDNWYIKPDFARKLERERDSKTATLEMVLKIIDSSKHIDPLTDIFNLVKKSLETPPK
jgi:hypothetical protein